MAPYIVALLLLLLAAEYIVDPQMMALWEAVYQEAIGVGGCVIIITGVGRRCSGNWLPLILHGVVWIKHGLLVVVLLVGKLVSASVSDPAGWVESPGRYCRWAVKQ